MPHIDKLVFDGDAGGTVTAVELVEGAVAAGLFGVGEESEEAVGGHLANEELFVLGEGEARWVGETAVGEGDGLFLVGDVEEDAALGVLEGGLAEGATVRKVQFVI